MYIFPFKKYYCKSLCRLFIVIIILSQPAAGYSQKEDYDEIIVPVTMQQVGDAEVNAVVTDNTVYLSVKQVFDFLKIKNTLSPDLTMEEGFLLNPKSTFVINKKNNTIVYLNKTWYLKPGDIIRTQNDLYLNSEYFGSMFELQCIFSVTDLSVTLTTTLPLPLIIEIQQQRLRLNLRNLKDERIADTIIKRRYPGVGLGVADWFANAVQEKNGKNNFDVNIDLGGVVAGGETNIYLNYNSKLPFSFKDQYYKWRYVNNDNAFLKQTTIGRLFTQSTSSLYASVTGVQFTNTPTTFRKSYGTYRFSDKTDPGSMVELYINNVLINFIKADASGFYAFEIPLVYGNSIIKLRFYSTAGEEKTTEQFITIPFNFIPLHQVEYTVTAGIVEDNLHSRFVRANINYGVTRHISIGGGTEYLSSVAAGKTMPFLTASMQIASNLLVSGEYTYGVRSKAVVSYRLPFNIQFDLNYIKYDKGQTAVKSSYSDEKKIVVSMPLRSKKYKGLTRFTVNQYVISKYKYTNAEFLLAGIAYGINTNFTTYAQFTSAVKPLVYSNLAVTFRIPQGIKITPQIKYEYSKNNVSMIRCEAEKKLFSKGYMNVSYEKNMEGNNQYISMGLRYNFSFAQTSLSVKNSDNVVTTTQSARGSIMYEEGTAHVTSHNQSALGKGGITVSPFLDINCNGIRDRGEPKVYGLNLHINGGRVKQNKRDTTISVSGLDAYTGYFIDLDENSFDNIQWHIQKKIIDVIIDPNHYKIIQIPVAVLGEVSGTVYNKINNTAKGIGRITVNFYNSHSVLVAQTLTEPDGYFSFMGLAPGKYTARIDTAQLQKLQMISSPALSFSIVAKTEGDAVDGIKFLLQSLSGECKVDKYGLLKDSDGDGVPDCRDKEIITPAACQPVDSDGVGKCIITDCCKYLPLQL